MNKEEIKKKAHKFMLDRGYGKGTNFTTGTVSNLMAEFYNYLPSKAPEGEEEEKWAKIKSDSKFRYAGLWLKVIKVHQIYNSQIIADIYPIGSKEYKLSLVGTKWENEYRRTESAYTIIHDSEIEEFSLIPPAQ